MPNIDLNSDLGEGIGEDAEIFPLISSANVACGGHAGDAATMARSVELAASHGVSLGAHPSYPDRDGFGRRDFDPGESELIDEVIDQVSALKSISEARGIEVRFLKPHGALYNRIARDPVQAAWVAKAAMMLGLPVLGLPGSAIENECARLGVSYFREAFVDRAYLPDGTLAPRSLRNSVIEDPLIAASRAIQIATEHSVEAIDGSILQIEVDSLCLHGDNPRAVRIVEAVRAGLARAAVEVRSFA